MSNEQENPLLLEWATLQKQFDDFEKLSLLIKLTAIVLTSMLVFDVSHPHIVPFLLSICWLQDAIWKTVQSRFSERLLVIENELAKPQLNATIQFNTAWESKPRSVFSLLSEYLRHLIKPTVIFPHAALLCVALYFVLLIE